MDRSATWHVGNLPFFYRCQTEPTNAAYGLPDRLPFDLEFDATLGLVRQGSNASVENALSIGYTHGSEISGMMDDDGIGRHYAEDFLAFIEEGEHMLGGKRVLEIGCGTGYLLSLLKARGAEVLGIEPGSQGQIGSERHGVRVIRGFFPHEAVHGKYDIVLAYGVLEHVTDPVEFMRSVAAYLTDDGVVDISVPDCESYLKCGDISCLLHEHWSYFTAASVGRTIGAAGFTYAVRKSGFGGGVYCRAHLDSAPGGSRQEEVDHERSMFDRFRTSFLQSSQRMARFFAEDGDAGVYVPGRVINLLSTLPSLSSRRMRFFDDNATLTGLFFPGFPVPIENFAGLVKSPPTRLFIASRSFQPQITERVCSARLQISILGWDDFFLSESTT